MHAIRDHVVSAEGESQLDRDNALQTARGRFEAPIWALLGQLEHTLTDFAKVQHIDLTDLRAVGSVLNSALPDAANTASVADHGLEVAHCRNGQSNKVAGTITLDGDDYRISFELHLCGPRGGTSKAAHQFAGYDIEQEPTFPGFKLEAPPDMLLFVACHLSGTGATIERAYLKFADGVDQRKIEIHRDIPTAMASAAVDAPVEGPAGAKLTIKKPMGDQEQDGSKADKRGDAASSSKKT